MFWGKLDRHSVIHMPRAKRKLWLKMTEDNLRMLYNTKESGKEEKEL